MNSWIIFGVIGVLVIAGIAVINAYSNTTTQKTATQTNTCSSCGNSCTAGKNCGLATCGAVNGGSCGCGK